MSKRIDDIKENLMKLDKEDLIQIILEVEHRDFLISETLVDESKLHIDSKKACEKIRDYMRKTKYINNISDENLKPLIDLDNGRISYNEYRRIVLGDDSSDD